MIKQLFCRHTSVVLYRSHSSCVTPDMREKVLYIDRYKVHNFIKCEKCGSILNARHTTEVFESIGTKPDFTLTDSMLDAGVKFLKSEDGLQFEDTYDQILKDRIRVLWRKITNGWK